MESRLGPDGTFIGILTFDETGEEVSAAGHAALDGTLEGSTVAGVEFSGIFDWETCTAVGEWGRR